MRTPRLLLQDILDSIAEIERYTPRTLAEFQANPPVESHIVRHIAIIGEAASRLPKELKDTYPTVPWRKIVDMRNIVVHVYHGINWERVYDTACKDIPAIKPNIHAILTSQPLQDGDEKR